MWIKYPENHTQVDLSVLDDAPSDETIELNDNGSANVSKTVGEYLLSDAYDGTVSKYTTDN